MNIAFSLLENGQVLKGDIGECTDYGLIQIIFSSKDGSETFHKLVGHFCRQFRNRLYYSATEQLEDGTFRINYAYNRLFHPYLYSFNTEDGHTRIEVLPDGLRDKDWEKGTYLPGFSPRERSVTICPPWILMMAEEISEAIREDLLNEAEWEQHATAGQDNNGNVAINPGDII